MNTVLASAPSSVQATPIAQHSTISMLAAAAGLPPGMALAPVPGTSYFQLGLPPQQTSGTHQVNMGNPAGAAQFVGFSLDHQSLTTLANVHNSGVVSEVNLNRGPHQSLAINLAIENASQALSQMNKRKPLPKSLKKPPKSHINCSSCCATDKPYVCDWVNCGKRFRQKPHLEAHKSIHTGRRFLCEYNGCGKSFVRKYNLVEHQKLHSPNSVNTCTVIDCGKVFSSKYSLMRHQNAQHNMNVKFTSM